MSISVIMGVAFAAVVLHFVQDRVRHRRSKMLKGASEASPFSMSEIESNRLLVPVLYWRAPADQLKKVSAGVSALLDMSDPRNPTLHQGAVARPLPVLDNGEWGVKWSIGYTRIRIREADGNALLLIVRSGFQREVEPMLKYRPVWRRRRFFGFTRLG